MKVYIKNKLISLGGSSTVTNENDETVFEVEGKLFSPTKKKIMRDVQGNHLYTIRNRFWNFFANKVFVFDAEKNKIATVKKNKLSFNFKYKIEDCVDSMEISGKFFSRTSQILRNGQVVGTLTRDFTIVKDAFTLEAEEKDIPFLTALVVAFDNVRDERENED